MKCCSCIQHMAKAECKCMFWCSHSSLPTPHSSLLTPHSSLACMPPQLAASPGWYFETSKRYYPTNLWLSQRQARKRPLLRKPPTRYSGPGYGCLPDGTKCCFTGNSTACLRHGLQEPICTVWLPGGTLVQADHLAWMQFHFHMETLMIGDCMPAATAKAASGVRGLPLHLRDALEHSTRCATSLPWAKRYW